MKYKAHLVISAILLICGCDRRGGISLSASLLSPPMAVASESRVDGPVAETAIVEHVFSASDNGFSCIAYQITWHGQQVIVDDPIHSTNFKVGDRLGVLVMRHDMSSPSEPKGQRLLSFQVLPYVPAPQP